MAKREKFQKEAATMSPATVDKLVFIDESGVHTNLVLRYARP